MQALIHLANLILLGSFLVRDILWLRVLTLVAGVMFIGYAGFSSPPLVASVAWNTLFVIINVVQVWRLLLERRPVRLRAEELALYQAAFRALTPREFSLFLAVARWADAAPGEVLVAEGVQLDRILVLSAGAADVVRAGAPVAAVRPGQLVGEMSFLTDAKTSAAVVATEPTRYLWVSSEALRALFEKQPALRAGMQMVIGHDLVAKLRAAAPRAA
jgi:hypothetical protein